MRRAHRMLASVRRSHILRQAVNYACCTTFPGACLDPSLIHQGQQNIQPVWEDEVSASLEQDKATKLNWDVVECLSVQRPDADGGGDRFDSLSLRFPHHSASTDRETLHVQTPHICSFRINAPHCEVVTLDKIEALHIEIRAKKLVASRLRGDKVLLTSETDISARLLEGSVKATAQSGNLAVNKLLATDAVLRASSSACELSGHVTVSAAYVSSLLAHADKQFTAQTLHGILNLHLGSNNGGLTRDQRLNAEIEGLKGQAEITATGSPANVSLQYDECMRGTRSKVHLQRGGSLQVRATQPAALQLHTLSNLPNESGACSPPGPEPAMTLSVPTDSIAPAQVRGSSRFAPPPPDVAVWTQPANEGGLAGVWTPLHFAAAGEQLSLGHDQLFPAGAVRMKLLGSAADQAIHAGGGGGGGVGAHVDAARGKIGHSGRHSSGAFYESNLRDSEPVEAPQSPALPALDEDCALLTLSTAEPHGTSVHLGVTGWRDVILQRMAKRRQAEGKEE